MNTQALGLLGEAPLGLTCSISLLMYVIMAFGYWRMFEKAGEKGWKSLIPVYNMYIAYTISWEKGKSAFFAVVALWFASFAFLLALASTAVTSPEWYIAGVTSFMTAAFACIIHALFCFKQAMSFDRGGGYAILAFFFYPFMMVYYGMSYKAIYYAPVE